MAAATIAVRHKAAAMRWNDWRDSGPYLFHILYNFLDLASDIAISYLLPLLGYLQ